MQPRPPACPACWDRALKSDSMDHRRPTQPPGPGGRGPWPTAAGPGPALPTKHRTSAVRPWPSRWLAAGPALARPWVPGRRGLPGWRPLPLGPRSVHAEHVAAHSMPHAHSSARLPARPWGPDWGASLPALSQPGSHLLAGGPSQEPRFIWFRFALTPGRLPRGPHPSPAQALLIGVITWCGSHSNRLHSLGQSPAGEQGGEAAPCPPLLFPPHPPGLSLPCEYCPAAATTTAHSCPRLAPTCFLLSSLDRIALCML